MSVIQCISLLPHCIYSVGLSGTALCPLTRTAYPLPIRYACDAVVIPSGLLGEATTSQRHLMGKVLLPSPYLTTCHLAHTHPCSLLAH